jgi:Family of unknown function (DUF6644)
LDAALVWLEASSLGVLMRSSGVWIYGVVNLAHILSVATLFGSVLVLDLKLLGLWRDVPLAAIERPTLPLALLGFCGAAVSGVCLITTNATSYFGNPFLLIKLGAVMLGVLNAIVLIRLPAWRERKTMPLPPGPRRVLAAAGGVSLASWLTAAAAGRMIGYW